MPSQRPPQRPDSAQPLFRSGAVARLAGMPVATLRIWEQRYDAVRPSTAQSGHRLYSAADVERVTWLRRLTEQGHAIGLLAALDIEQLRELMHASPGAGSNNVRQAPAQPLPMGIVVVGQALASRLKRWAGRQPGGLALHWVAVFDSLAEAAQAAQHLAAPGVDLLLWQAPSLQPGAGHDLRLAQDAWCAQAAGVVYRYGNTAARAELMNAGAAVFHEPADDESLGQWLAWLHRSARPADEDRNAFNRLSAPNAPGLAGPVSALLADQLVSAPRFADLALTEFAGLSSAMACECPSHLAELLLQISNFETYSGDCANKSVADAQLHAYLQRVAGAARMLFETALEQVAIAEGLPLPQAVAGLGSHSFSAAASGRHAPTVSSL